MLQHERISVRFRPHAARVDIIKYFRMMGIFTRSNHTISGTLAMKAVVIKCSLCVALCVAGVIGLPSQSAAADAKDRLQSVYTDLSGKNCTRAEVDKQTGASSRECPGVANFRLIVADDDERMSITVIAPDGTRYPLNYWDVITRSFSTLGQRAEWRIMEHNGSITPVALIVRVNWYDQENLESPKRRSSIAIAKLQRGDTCVVGKIGSVPNGNQLARQIGADAPNRACLKP